MIQEKRAILTWVSVGVAEVQVVEAIAGDNALADGSQIGHCVLGGWGSLAGQHLREGIRRRNEGGKGDCSELHSG
jgi:hypothetical protein